MTCRRCREAADRGDVAALRAEYRRHHRWAVAVWTALLVAVLVLAVLA